MSPSRLTVIILAVFAAAAAGCGYMIGAPYRDDIRTVHVPIVESLSFRRDVEFQLTEAVHKEIQQRTHFRLARPPHADTRLTARIVRLDKFSLGENAFDDPRELQLHLAIEVTWEDLRTGRMLQEEQIPIAPDVVHLLATADFAPEVGQSRATAAQQALDRMAAQIVQMMEYPW